MAELSRRVCLLWLAALITTGCGRHHNGRGEQVVEPLDAGPNVEWLVAPSDYATKAIESAGGLKPWVAARKLELECVVTVYQPDGSFYVTEHNFEIFPWSNSIRISALEPGGKFIWQLSDGRFSVLDGYEPADVSPMAGAYRDFADVMLQITTAPVRFFDKGTSFSRSAEPVRIKGLWYFPIEVTYAPEGGTLSSTAVTEVEPVKPYWSKAFLFQNKDSSVIDMISLANVAQQKFLVVRGYDYSDVKNSDVLIPTKMEVFRADAQGIIGQRWVQVNVKQ